VTLTGGGSVRLGGQGAAPMLSPQTTDAMASALNSDIRSSWVNDLGGESA
jgi:hypothetical protein